MKKLRWLFVLSFIWVDLASAADLPKIAILPFRPDEPKPQLKEEGEAIADYLQGKLADFPNVEWVDRSDLDKLLSEDELNSISRNDKASIKLGRLAKADILLHGQIGPYDISTQYHGSEQVTLEFVDLTNAEVLARDTIKWEKLGKLDGRRLEDIADSARKLLAEALEKRVQQANAVTLAPVFFSNSSLSTRLDSWEPNWLSILRASANGFPRLKILEFPRTGQAREEQSLAILGLTATDPLAWQKVAQIYLWGGYHEIPSSSAVSFDDTKVEVEVFLWNGNKNPERFTRIFAVKDFRSSMEDFAHEILAAASSMPPCKATSKQAQDVANLMFSHLCDQVHAGFLSNKEDWKELEQWKFSPRLLLDPFQAGVYSPEPSVDYRSRIIDLCSFFDPKNPKRNIMRLVSARSWTGLESNLDEDFADDDERLNQLELLFRQPDFDAAFFVTGMNSVFFPRGYLMGDDDLPPDQKAKFEELLERYTKLLRDTAPTVNNEFVKAGLHPWNVYQYTLGDMFNDIEGNGLSASVRLNFLENVWPLINQEQREDLLHPQGISMPHYAATFRHLADEIGDPKRVWDILATPPLADSTPPSAKAAIAPTPIVPQGPTLAFAQLRQHLIDNNKPPPEPLLLNIAPVEAPPTEIEAYSPDSPSGLRLRSFADQLIMGRSRYDMSTGQEKSLSNAPGGWGGFAALSGDRVFYFLNGGLGWLDLMSGDSGKFSFDRGMPVSNPSMVGAAGQRYLFVGGGAPPLAGYYDFQKQSWVTPAHDPFQDKTSNGGTGEAIGNDEWMLFPQWSMIYNVKNSTWRDVSTVIVNSEEQGAATTEKMATYFGHSLALDQDFLLWNKRGIVQYSPDLNRVVWSAKATNLQDVASEGPYLWLLFSNSSDYPRMLGVPPIPESSTILLVNRTDKTNLGAWKIPYGSWSLCLSDNEVWLTSSTEKRPNDFSNSSPQQTLVWRGEKKDFYEALNLAPPPPNKSPPRPSFFPSRGAELYEVLIRQDVDGARELLNHGVSANSLVGVDQTPALNVAVWTRNSEMVKLFLNHGVDLSGTALEIASKEEDPTIARLLITAGANPDGRSPDRSALSEAVRCRNIEVVKLLAKAGAQLLKMDAAGNLFDPHGSGRYGPDIIGLVKDATMAKCLLGLYPQLPLYWKNMLEKIAYPDGLLTIDPNISSDLDELCRAIVDASNSFERSNELIQLIPKDKLNDPRVTALVAGKILFGQTKIVGAFLAAGVDLNQVINTSWPDPKSPLSLYFDYSRHADMLLFLMDHGYDPTKEFSSNLLGFSKLACWDRDPVFWNELLQNSINLSQKCGYGTLGSYGLVWAVDGRNGIAVKALLAHGANPNAVGHDGYSPLQVAFAVRSPDLACLLAGSHADLNFRDLFGRTAFDPPYLIDSYFVPALLSYQPGSDVEKAGQQILLSTLQGRPTYRELFDAVGRLDAPRVKDLLQRGAPVDTSRELYQKPGLVFLASLAGRTDLVNLLLDHGCDPNIGERGVDNPNLSFSIDSSVIRSGPLVKTCPNCQTPLMAASKLGSAEIIRVLLDHGAYAPALDEFGRTAIDQAANPEIAKLIEDRTQVQFLAEKLMSAIQPPIPASPNWPDLDSIHQIVRTDPSCVNVKNATGVIPLLLVASFLSDPNKQILKVFHDCGCGMDALDTSGMTPLHHAVLDVDDQRAADLVKLGFSPLTPDSRGITALDLTEGILDEGARSKMISILRNPDILPHSDTEAHSKSQ